jgi:hypothetical protein
MKSDTQIKIGRVAALVPIFRNLAAPIVVAIRERAAQQLSSGETLIYLVIGCFIALPLLAVSVGFYWALLGKKLKLGIVLFVILVLWGVWSGIVAIVNGDGIGTLVLEIVILLILLQGILGVGKLRTPVSET